MRYCLTPIQYQLSTGLKARGPLKPPGSTTLVSSPTGVDQVANLLLANWVGLEWAGPRRPHVDFDLSSLTFDLSMHPPQWQARLLYLIYNPSSCRLLLGDRPPHIQSTALLYLQLSLCGSH